jgi:hypothetical protein
LWVASWAEHSGSSEVVVFWGSGEIPVGLFGTDAVTPMGATIPSCRASGVPLFHPLGIPGPGNPRTCPGNNVVVVFLLEGVAWYVALRSARSVVGLLHKAQRWRVIFVLSICRCRHLILFYFSYFVFLGLVVLPPQQTCIMWLLSI